MARPLYRELWYEALASPYGIVVKTDAPEEFKAQLYRMRDYANDPDLYSITIATPPPSSPQDELWLVKRQGDPKK